jgi:hypothetical protein
LPPTEFRPVGIQVLDLTPGTYRISAVGLHHEVLEADIAMSVVDLAFPDG